MLEGTDAYLSEEELNNTKNEMLRWNLEHDIEWICSYLSYDRTRFISELIALDLKAVQEVQQKLKIPSSHVWSAKVLSPKKLA